MTPSPSITVSLEWAKKLKEAGWPQEDKFYYNADGDLHWIYEEHDDAEERERISAPTAEELLRKLPPIIVDPKDENKIIMNPRNQALENWNWRREDSLANAAAGMWCYLKENNLLSPQP